MTMRQWALYIGTHAVPNQQSGMNEEMYESFDILPSSASACLSGWPILLEAPTEESQVKNQMALLIVVVHPVCLQVYACVLI